MPSENLTDRFENIFRRLLAREKIELFEKDLSLMFEGIATTLLRQTTSREGCYFDGVIGMTAVVKTRRKIQFDGEMWIGKNKAQWTEPFRATVTDKRPTKQGIWIAICVGNDKAEAELCNALPSP